MIYGYRNQDEAVACAAAEQASPGWQAVAVEQGTSFTSDAPPSDFSGRALDALKDKYLGAAKDGPPDAGAKVDDVKFVSMEPKVETDSPIKTRKVIVAGNEVVGFQG